MSDDSEASRLRAAAKLSAMPGVIRVVDGLKEAGGQILPQRVLRVHVARKRPLADLDPAERIPSEIEGIATDVIVAPHRVLTSSLPTLSPGVKIRRNAPGDFNAGGGGTLGMMVDLAGQRMLLTNEHVLGASQDNAFNREIYSPDISGDRDCPCNRPCANIPDTPAGKNALVPTTVGDETRDFKVDARLATLVGGVTSTNFIDGVGAITGGRDLSTLDPAAILDLHVTKRGMMTGVTEGTIVGARNMSPPNEWELYINNPSGGTDYDETFTLTKGMDQDAAAIAADIMSLKMAVKAEAVGDDLRVFGKVLAIRGDSGSVFVDDAGAVVGLLYAVDGVKAWVDITVRVTQTASISLIWGRPVACYIKPVFDALTLPWPAAISPATTPARGARIDVPVERAPWPDPRVMHELDAALARTSRGRLLMALGQRLYQQVATLVHHRRRVTVTWHRSRGPAFVNAFLRALATTDQLLPVEVGGVRLVDALLRMRAALELEGDPSLRVALAEHGDFILALARARSVPELLLALDEAG